MIRSFSRSLLLFPLLLVACGGATEYQVHSSNLAPGADALVSADVDADTHKTTLNVDVKNLTPASRIDADKKHFVLWHRKNSDRAWARLGALDYDADARSGRFEGSVPETGFELIVTAEKELAPASPSAHVVFSQTVRD